MFKVSIIEDSVAATGSRITTMQLTYPRYIHSEFLTHRAFSRNASSSRAIPVSKSSSAAIENMVEPIRYGKNQSGMQASMEDLQGADLEKAQEIWRRMASQCAAGAKELAELGLHKQWANRPIEWFSHITVLVTATEWDNFFALRCHPDAQPEFQVLANAMKAAMDESKPADRGRPGYQSHASSWHLPYIKPGEREYYLPSLLPKLSAARCARVSYLTHDGENPQVGKDLDLFNRLVGANPIHASPVEHQAYPARDACIRSGNFVGWVQYRQVMHEVFA